MTGDRIIASDWGSIADAPNLSDRERNRVVTAFNEEDANYVVWMPEWLADDKGDLKSLEKFYRLFVGEIEDYSDKAWRLWQPQHKTESKEPNDYLPKSQVVVFEALAGSVIDRPQASVTAFAKGDEV